MLQNNIWNNALAPRVHIPVCSYASESEALFSYVKAPLQLWFPLSTLKSLSFAVYHGDRANCVPESSINKATKRVQTTHSKLPTPHYIMVV